jgi:hypothetical protein
LRKFDDPFLQELPQFVSGNVAVGRGAIRLAFERGHELLAKNAVIRNCLIRRASGDELPDSGAGFVFDVGRGRSPSWDREYRTRETTIEDRQNVPRLNPFGIYLEHLHVDSFGQEAVEVHLGLRSIGRNDVTQLFAVGRLLRVAMAGKIEKQPVLEIQSELNKTNGDNSNCRNWDAKLRRLNGSRQPGCRLFSVLAPPF